MRKFKPGGKTPLKNGYQTKLEQKKKLNPELASSYLKMIGILRWAVELGNIGIFTEGIGNYIVLGVTIIGTPIGFVSYF